jgi:hypothetical protein
MGWKPIFFHFYCAFLSLLLISLLLMGFSFPSSYVLLSHEFSGDHMNPDSDDGGWPAGGGGATASDLQRSVFILF